MTDPRVDDRAISIVVVHNSEIYAHGLATALHHHGYGTVVNPSNLLGLIDQQAPDVLVCHVDEPVVPEILRRQPQVVVVAVIDKDEAAEYQRGFAIGAAGILTATATTDHAIRTVEAAAKGYAYLPHPIARHLAVTSATPTPAGTGLTDTETDILDALTHGATISAIANKIGYSERQTHKILKRLYQRLGVANRAEAITLAARWNITHTHTHTCRSSRTVRLMWRAGSVTAVGQR
jgi:DNA-binding NarL/FixJ family response regulator